jgi:iron only hydrogenase large subunit-like protein
MSVFLNNLDDFIAPSQACINPFVLNRKPDSESKPASMKITLKSDFSSTEYETPKANLIREPDLIKTRVSTASKGQKVAAVSLNDCLACSGCVTSAETVLIQEQSFLKLLERLGDHARSDEIVIVCLSPQSIASMATFVGTSSSNIFLRVATMLKDLGVHYVVDASSAGDVALIEGREEFLRRYQNGRSALWSKPPHTVAASSESVYLIPSIDSSNNTILFGGKLNEFSSRVADSSSGNKTVGSESMSNGNVLLEIGAPINGDQSLPMLASQCPGWVCYAEKTQPQSLPFISHTKSPQQIVGAVMKQVIFRSQLLTNSTAASTSSSSTLHYTGNITSTNPDSIVSANAAFSRKVKSVYIVSVQPCFDKKLESSRKDFFHQDTDCQEVDLVLSTTEMWSLIEERANASNSRKNATSTIPSATVVKAATVVLDGIEGSVIPMITTEEEEEIAVSGGEYLLNLSPDSPHGRDEIESIFRSYSPDGKAFVSAVDSNGSSGGYLEHIFRFAAERLGGVNLWGKPLVYTAGRNVDVCEVALSNQQVDSSTGTAPIKLKFGKAYGFRNIQSLLLKMKQGKCDLDFVEVMACPSGCVNGGGQLKESMSEGNGEMIRELSSVTTVRVLAVESTFHCSLPRRPEDSPLVKYLFSSVSSEQTAASVSVSEDSRTHPTHHACHDGDTGPRSVQPGGVLGSPLGPSAMAVLHTRYHSVPKLVLLAPLAAKW